MLLKTLDVICRAGDAPSARFSADDLDAWHEGIAEELSALGILKEVATAFHVVCDACAEGHIEPVDRVEYPDGTVRFFIRCPENGRVEVPSARLRQWGLDFDCLAVLLNEAMGGTGTPDCLSPDRLWRIGKARVRGRSREIYLARGLLWPDAVDVVKQARIRRDSVVFVLGGLPEDALCGATPPHRMEFGHVVSVGSAGLCVDLDHIEAQVELAEEVEKKKPQRKRSGLVGDIDRLVRELEQYFRDAKKLALDTLREPDGPTILRRPLRKELARQCDLSEAKVSRCFRDPSAKMLRILWEKAGTREGVMSYRSR